MIDGKKHYGQPINYLIRHYDEFRKIARGQGSDYTTGCLLISNTTVNWLQSIWVNKTQ